MPRLLHHPPLDLADSPATVHSSLVNINITLANLLLIIVLLLTLPLVTTSPITSSVDQKSAGMTSLEVERRNVSSDPRRIMCGYQLIVNLKMQCGDRGTFSPYERGPRVKRGLRLGRPTPLYSPIKSRGRKYDDLCSIYLRYEPYTIVTECCCRGCTRRFLEQFCAKS